MGWFRRRDRDAIAPATAEVVVSSPGGPTTSWPGRTLADQTFATVRGTPVTSWPRPGLTIGGRRLPGILVPSRTDELVARANGSSEVFVVRHDFLAGEVPDRLTYVGVGARAMICLHLSAANSPELNVFGVALPERGARLWVHAHRAGRYGFLRLNLMLPGLPHDFDTGISPVEGDVQEFLAVAYQTGVVELHISRDSGDGVLACACTANGLRPVVDRALAALADADHPASPAEHAAFNAGLRSALVAVNDQLDPAAAIDLTVTKQVPSFVAVEVA